MAMLPKIFDSISHFQTEEELPYLESLDDYIDYILPSIRTWGEDLYEEDYYLSRSWLEFRDDENFHETIIHIFNDGREYLRAKDGDIRRGSWEIMEGTNQLILDSANGTELYNLAFLNSEFFILKKHGNQKRLGNTKYFVMGREGAMKNPSTGGYLTWREYVESLSNVYEKNNSIIWVVAIIVVAIIVAFYLFSGS